MLLFFSWVLTAVYVLLPIVSVGILLIYRRSTRRQKLRRAVFGGWFSGGVLAGGVLAIYSAAIGGRPGVGQGALAIYFGISLILLLKGFDHLLRQIIWRLFNRAGRRVAGWRTAGAVLTRIIILSAVALPWVMAALMVYRPKIIPVDTPSNLLGLTYSDVTCTAADGTRVAGWFIASGRPSSTTVLLCHGLGAGKASMWRLMSKLHESGLNVLTIDLRAHAESGGQMTTFGGREQLDINAAVRWLKAEKGPASSRVVGVGASMGAAALVNAAANNLSIDAVAVIDTFDSLPLLLADVGRVHFIRPLAWLTEHVAIHIGSLHAGVDFTSIVPADAVEQIWPRPVLVIHTTEDEIIPFERGRKLFESAAQPRDGLWLDGTHNGVLDDRRAINAVVDFAAHAKAVPVI